MDVAALADKLQQDMADVAEEDRVAFFRGWSANLAPAERTAMTALAGLFGFGAPPLGKHIVVLLHGIRTAAVWQEAVKRMFDETNVTVIPIGYEYLDVARFLWPWGRGGAIARVSRELQAIKRDNPETPISIIAHSFGTYIVSKVLYPDQGIRLKRLLLCGSIVPSSFPWENVQGLPKRDSIVNDVGTRDVWPVLARTLTWGYGSSGTFGFKQYVVIDRFHDLTHSDFFAEAWVRKFWLPFICDGSIAPSDWEAVRPTPPGWLSLLTVIHLKYLLVLVLVLIVWIFWR